jgi:hypothetical protein
METDVWAARRADDFKPALRIPAVPDVLQSNVNERGLEGFVLAIGRTVMVFFKIP